MSFFTHSSPQNSPWQWIIAKGFATANSIFMVITSAKILPRWLFPSKIYIQFTIFNICFLTELSFTNKQISLAVSVCATRNLLYIYYIFFIFITFLFIHMAIEQAFLSCRILSYQRNSLRSHFQRAFNLFHSFTLCSSGSTKEK